MSTTKHNTTMEGEEEVEIMDTSVPYDLVRVVYIVRVCSMSGTTSSLELNLCEVHTVLRVEHFLDLSMRV